jgi:hypothetical protein
MVSLNDDALPCTCRYRSAVLRLGAKASSRRVPSLGSWMTMFWGHIAGVRNSLGVLGRVLLTGLHDEWADLGHPHTTGWSPPDLTESLDNGSAWTLRHLGGITRRIRVQMPKDSRLCQLSELFGHDEPTTNVAPGPFADR